MTILRTSSISNPTKELHVNADDSTTYVDHFKFGSLSAAITLDNDAWAEFIEAEAKRLGII